jgi:hypothetical protein
MANSRTSTHPIPLDFPAILDANFQQINYLPPFNIDCLHKDDDWYLLCFLKEQQRNGHSYEVTFAALHAIVGTLSEQSYFHNPVNNTIGFLNQNHHLLGESGKCSFCLIKVFSTINDLSILASNKSSICQEISIALQSLIQSFPGRYSSSKENLNTETDDNYNNNKTNKSKSQALEYSLVVSNVTEVGLTYNLSKINTILLHSDGDVALNQLGYYEQGKNETSGGVSLFCDASDGIRGGFIRGTGVSQIKMDRPIALFNMFIASTGTKIALMLQRFYDTRNQDGVFGRVFYTWCPSVDELPKIKSKCFTNIPSFSHFSHAVACFFVHQYQFRHTANASDIEEVNTERKYFSKF